MTERKRHEIDRLADAISRYLRWREVQMEIKEERKHLRREARAAKQQEKAA
jgi:hypothetical protein